MDDQGQKNQGSGVPRYEKQQNGQEKQEEKGQGLDEKYQKNPIGFVSFALALIWLGVFLLLRNRNIIQEDDKHWAILVWGLAGLGLVEILIRLAIPRWRQSLSGNFVWVAVWTGVGFGLWSGDDWEIIGPIVLIAVGIALVVGRILPRR